MDSRSRATLSFLGFAALALAHALWTWPLHRVLVLFVGGAAIAFLGEAAVIRLGLLEHHTGPKIAGVPLAIVAVWPAVVYAFSRLALLVVDTGPAAAALAALLATAWDLLTDPRGVGELWTYPESALSSPRIRGVPWWNFAGWLLIVFVIALLPSIVSG